MITIAHVMVGGATAVALNNFTDNMVILGAAAVASHFAMDIIPHLDVHPNAPRNDDGQLIWTSHIWIQAVSDVLIASLLVLLLWYVWFDFPTFTPFVIGAAGGFLPDFLDNVPFWNKPLRKTVLFKQFHAFHEQLHHVWEHRYPMTHYAWLGVATQVIAVGISAWYLAYFL